MSNNVQNFCMKLVNISRTSPTKQPNLSGKKSWWQHCWSLLLAWKFAGSASARKHEVRSFIFCCRCCCGGPDFICLAFLGDKTGYYASFFVVLLFAVVVVFVVSLYHTFSPSCFGLRQFAWTSLRFEFFGLFWFCFLAFFFVFVFG